MRNPERFERRDDADDPALEAFYADQAALLNTLGIAFCLFSSDDRAVLWNDAFLRFFPEHDQKVYRGEPYGENLRRFYEGRLSAQEMPQLETYVAEGISRHRAQLRPYTFVHRDRLLQVASLPTVAGYRPRLWQQIVRDDSEAAALKSVEAPSLDMLDHIADGAVILDAEDRVVASNVEFKILYDVPVSRNIVDCTLASIVELAWRNAGKSDPNAESAALLDNIRFAGAPFEVELPGDRWRRIIARRQSNGIGFFTHSDVTMVKRQQRAIVVAEKRARESEYRYRLLADLSSDVILAVSRDGRITYASPAAPKVLGRMPERLVGTAFVDLICPEDRGQLASLAGGCERGMPARITCRVRRAASKWRWVEISVGAASPVETTDGMIDHVCSLRDITERVEAQEQLKQSNEDLAALAETDGLTGLANRRRFNADIQTQWRSCLREETALSVLLVDIDFFKSVNDRFGHATGDACISRVGHLIKKTLRRPTDIAARLGGDEFAAILRATGAAGAKTVAESIRRAVRDEDWRSVHPDLQAVTISVGICSIETPSSAAHCDIVALADAALYDAKRDGRDRIEVSTDATDDRKTAA